MIGGGDDALFEEDAVVEVEAVVLGRRLHRAVVQEAQQPIGQHRAQLADQRRFLRHVQQNTWFQTLSAIELEETTRWKEPIELQHEHILISSRSLPPEVARG